MTLIILAALAAAWLGYLALWLRDRRASRPQGGDGVVGLNPAFAALERTPYLDTMERGVVSIESVGIGSIGDSARPLGDLLDTPRSRQQAHRRRRHVAMVLIAVAVGSLVAVSAFGATALAVHVLVDLVLVLFACGSIHRQQPLPVDLADVRVLYRDRSAPSDAVAMPLRRVAGG
ncbi:MAG: hypothetical protein OXC00_16285 [Acidimicrobiaceae bacterium]|nr:hypothetical protein [Acidimicrobiaceae bacterium]